MVSRGSFTNRLGFVAAAAGSAVGLGNIWKFPYEAGENGGGAFLLVTLLCTFIIGFPVMVGEIAIGRNAQADPYGSYRKLGNKTWALLGLYGVLCGIMILSFYNVVAGWAFGYFLNITFGDLLAQPDYGSYFGEYVTDFGDNLIFSLAFMLMTSIIVVRGIRQGIETAAKIMMPGLFLILVLLIIYALTLENAWEGIKFYLVPDLEKITIKTVYSALGQSFFSLSLGMGAIITYGSYINKREDILASAAIVSTADFAVAFLSGMMIFPLVFSQGMEPTGGPGLVFVALPSVFHDMGPFFGRLVGGSFFLLLCFAALTSTISLLEVPVSLLVDEYKLPRKLAAYGLSALIFIVGLPSMLSQGAVEWLTTFLEYEGKSQTFLDVIADVFSDVSLTLGGCMMCIFIATRWKYSNMSAEIAESSPYFSGSWLDRYLRVMICYVCPILLGGIFLITVFKKFLGIDLIQLFAA